MNRVDLRLGMWAVTADATTVGAVTGLETANLLGGLQYTRFLREDLALTLAANALPIDSGTSAGPSGTFAGSRTVVGMPLSTTNRSFKGRMGNPNSAVYLCSPEVAAANGKVKSKSGDRATRAVAARGLDAHLSPGPCASWPSRHREPAPGPEVGRSAGRRESAPPSTPKSRFLSLPIEAEGWSFLSGHGFRVMLGECPDARPASDLADHSYFMHLIVEGLDALHQEFESRGAEVIYPPADRPWGLREFGIRTPDGHRIVFGEPVPEP